MDSTCRNLELGVKQGYVMEIQVDGS